jgi:hypothetical protein
MASAASSPNTPSRFLISSGITRAHLQGRGETDFPSSGSMKTSPATVAPMTQTLDRSPIGRQNCHEQCHRMLRLPLRIVSRRCLEPGFGRHDALKQ